MQELSVSYRYQKRCQMRYVSVEDFRKKLNKKDSYDSYIRRLCRDGKLEHIMEESEKGNPKYMIDLEGTHAKKVLLRSSTDTDIETEYIGTVKHNYTDTEPVQHEESENIRLLIEELSTTRHQLIEFAQQAGQSKLLTDNLISKEKDTKYWQEKYFEIQAGFNRQTFEIEALNKQIEVLQQEKQQQAQTLEAENQQLKQKQAWWKFSK